MMNEDRFVFVADENCLWDRIGKRKYYMGEDLADKMNNIWNQTKRFEGYCNEYKKQLYGEELDD